MNTSQLSGDGSGQNWMSISLSVVLTISRGVTGIWSWVHRWASKRDHVQGRLSILTLRTNLGCGDDQLTSSPRYGDGDDEGNHACHAHFFGHTRTDTPVLENTYVACVTAILNWRVWRFQRRLDMLW